MIFYELIDKDGVVLASTFVSFEGKDAFKNLESRAERNGVQYAYRKYECGIVRLIATEQDATYLASGRQATKTLDAYSQVISLLSNFENRHKKQYTILSHNLVTTHGRLMDLTGSLVPGQRIASAGTHDDQIEIVEKVLKGNTRKSSDIVLSIAKRTADLQAQIDGFSILSGTFDCDLESHNGFRLLHNIIFPFVGKLFENKISIKWHGSEDLAESNKLRTNYSAFNVAMHHFFNNVIKYARKGSILDIEFDAVAKKLIFTMKSVKIDQAEIQDIFEIGVRGKYVEDSDIEGDGIGMYMVKVALDLLGAKILIVPDYATEDYDPATNNTYVKNKFLICF